jgi:DNA primase
VAGLVSPNTLEQIRAANDIVDVVGAVVPLKRAGANFRGLCPFHREKTPSFNVHPGNQMFKCFGCGKGGDVFTFVREYEGLDFMGAVRRLAERARITLEFENNPAAQQARHIKEVLWQIHEQITQRWHTVLLNDAAGQVARDYLHKRGVTDEAVKLFRIGAAPESWDDTVNWARSKSHDLAVVEQAGLIIQKEGTDRHYDRFRGRLIFPICDEQGRVIGFSGRILSGDEKVAKYVNSPETPIFTKGKVFFGLDKSKRALLDAQTAVVCEGQLDLISCYMAGVKNIVAPQGTALTPDHARILKRYVEEVVLCFDADNAGQKAAVRSLEPLLSAGLAVRVAAVPSGKDPDEFIKEHGGEAFQKLIAGAEGFFDFYLKRLCATNDVRTDKGRMTVLREFNEALAKTGNAVLIDTYAQKAAQRLGVEAQSVRAEFKKVKAHVAPVRDDEPPLDDLADEGAGQGETVLEPPTTHEMQLLKIILEHDEQAQAAADLLQPEWIRHPVLLRLVEKRLTLAARQEHRSAPAFYGEFQDDPAAQEILSTAMADDRPLPSPEVQLRDVVGWLRMEFFKRRAGELRHAMVDPALSDQQRAQAMRELTELRHIEKAAQIQSLQQRMPK